MSDFCYVAEWAHPAFSVKCTAMITVIALYPTPSFCVDVGPQFTDGKKFPIKERWSKVDECWLNNGGKPCEAFNEELEKALAYFESIERQLEDILLEEEA